MNISSFEDAASYNDVSAVYIQNRLNTKLLKLATFDKMDTVLEVGCGPGDITRQLASNVKSVIGIDVSPNLIEYATKHNSTTNTEYIVLDAMNMGSFLQERRQSFDKIYSSAVIQWCPDQGSVLTNMYECLKPGGTLMLGFVFQSALGAKTCRFGDTVDTWLRKHPKWGSIFTDSVQVDYFVAYENEESFLKFFQSFGFTVLKSEVVDPWIEPDEKLMRVEVSIMLKHMEHVPDNLKESFLDDVCEYLYDISPKRPDGKVHGDIGPYDYLHVVAKK